MLRQQPLTARIKKCALQEKQLQDSEKKEKYRIYGEMLNTYGYEAERGIKKYP